MAALKNRLTMPTKFKQIRPETETVTDYNRACLKLYLILLDAEKAGSNWIEAHKLAFGMTSTTALKRRRRQYEAHLKRAHWMAKYGYRHLL
jgi:hypothetical protein